MERRADGSFVDEPSFDLVEVLDVERLLSTIRAERDRWRSRHEGAPPTQIYLTPGEVELLRRVLAPPQRPMTSMEVHAPDTLPHSRFA